MVDREYVESQLKKISFGTSRFNRAEVRELEQILLEDEKVYECVNGYYEGGVALLVATDIRVLLIDKKPMGFLNVDDMRFDMISDIDYSQRVFGASLAINCGMRSLCFKSYNRPRLRKLVGHIQHRISEIKREQTQHATLQKQHLEDINRQLQMYLLAQQQHLERQLIENHPTERIKPSPQLADYLFAQRLLEDFEQKGIDAGAEESIVTEPLTYAETLPNESERELLAEMEEAARREVFVRKDQPSINSSSTGVADDNYYTHGPTPLEIAYAKLPYLLRSRRYRQPVPNQNIS